MLSDVTAVCRLAFACNISGEISLHDFFEAFVVLGAFGVFGLLELLGLLGFFGLLKFSGLHKFMCGP